MKGHYLQITHGNELPNFKLQNLQFSNYKHGKIPTIKQVRKDLRRKCIANMTADLKHSSQIPYGYLCKQGFATDGGGPTCG